MNKEILVIQAILEAGKEGIVKKAGCLSAIMDLDGVLATDRNKIEDIVLGELAKKISGRKSKSFSHGNEQLIKEAVATSPGGWEEWISDTVDPLKFEDQVCRPVGETEIESIINGLKRHQAPFVDWVTTMMLKCAGPALRKRLSVCQLFRTWTGS